MRRGALLCFLLSMACSQPSPPAPARAFYSWRTRFAPTPIELEALKRLRVTRLYLRAFDVAWRAGAAVPVGRVALEAGPPPGVEVVPVVFVTNEAMRRTDDPGALAERTWREVRSLGLAFAELQVDCDWTTQSRGAYFAFLEALRALAAPHAVHLSATIRLHQVKYARRTGVPPVERGALMFYNVGELVAGAPRPSIFNAEDASRYLERLDEYPLPLDTALALFSWAVHERGARVVGLLEKPDVAALAAEPALSPDGPGRYRVTRDALVGGAHLAEGDVLRLEQMTPALAHQAAALLDGALHPKGPTTRILFDLDERTLAAHPLDDLDALFLPRP
ncbi:MAG: hypothetical protein INH41_08835 [Myxococcaceae bacterium]|nr:hypothetical protein [Myxococcaceae bacterium]MCA3012489.1 hypothetical protein [Myxococcaceae bacterium]